MVLYVFIKRSQVRKTNVMYEPRVLMSGLGTAAGYENPMANFDDDVEGFDTADQEELVKELGKQ